MFHSPACRRSLLPGWWHVPGLRFVVGWASSAVSRVGWGAWPQLMASCDPSPYRNLEQPAHRAPGWLGDGSWGWIVVGGGRRSSSCQLHLHWVVVTDCQGLEEGERWGGVTQGFGELRTPHCAGGAGRVAMIALPELSACWREHDVLYPEMLSTQGSSFGTSQGEMPRRGLG